MPKCMVCGEEVIGDYYTCPEHGYNICAFHCHEGWPRCPSCGNLLEIRRTYGLHAHRVTLSGPGVLGEAFGKTALVIGIIIAVVLLIIFFYFIVSGVIGGVIGYLFYWLNQKRSLIKIADHWIFIIAIVLTIIFVVIGRLVFSPANYIAAVLIGFIIGYWIRKKLEEED